MTFPAFLFVSKIHPPGIVNMTLRVQKCSHTLVLPPGENARLSLSSPWDQAFGRHPGLWRRDCDAVYLIKAVTKRGQMYIYLETECGRFDGGPPTRVEHPACVFYPFTRVDPFYVCLLSCNSVALGVINASKEEDASLCVYWRKGTCTSERPQNDKVYEQEFGITRKVHLRYREGLCGVDKVGSLGPNLFPGKTSKTKRYAQVEATKQQLAEAKYVGTLVEIPLRELEPQGFTEIVHQ